MKCSLRPWLFLVAGLLDDLRPVMKMPKPLPRSSSRRATISEYKRRAQNYVPKTRASESLPAEDHGLKPSFWRVARIKREYPDSPLEFPFLEVSPS